jgi:hypothetical protein
MVMVVEGTEGQFMIDWVVVVVVVLVQFKIGWVDVFEFELGTQTLGW